MLNIIEKFLQNSAPKTLAVSNELKGIKVAILATDGFEQSELFSPKEALETAGADVKIISLKAGWIKGWNKKDWGKSIKVDMTVKDALNEDFNALVLPGGVINPDKLRIDEDAMNFIGYFVARRLPIGAICHGPWTLIEAEAVMGIRMTSWPSLKKDLMNAGAEWVDAEVVVDDNIITSRMPSDLAAFNDALIREFAGSSSDISTDALNPTASL